MEESENNTNLIDKITASAYNKEIATYRGDQEIIESSQIDFEKAILRASSIGFSNTDINKAETVGRLKAAIEEGKKVEEEFYQKSLEDLEENP